MKQNLKKNHLEGTSSENISEGQEEKKPEDVTDSSCDTKSPEYQDQLKDIGSSEEIRPTEKEATVCKDGAQPYRSGSFREAREKMKKRFTLEKSSAFGNVKDEGSPPDPVPALVLLFYKPPADPETEHEINVLMLPKNVGLDKVLHFRRKLDQDEIFLMFLHCKLQPNQFYSLSASPGGESVLVQPTEAEFDAEFSDNYLSKFCVSFEKMMKHIRLSLRDSSSNIVWERRVCLPAAGVIRSWGPTRQNLSPQGTLKEKRNRPTVFGLAQQIRLKKLMKTESECEKAEKKRRCGKVLRQPLTTDSSEEETRGCSTNLNVSPSSDPTQRDSVPIRSASIDLLQTSGSSFRRKGLSNLSSSLNYSLTKHNLRSFSHVSILPSAFSSPNFFSGCLTDNFAPVYQAPSLSPYFPNGSSLTRFYPPSQPKKARGGQTKEQEIMSELSVQRRNILEYQPNSLIEMEERHRKHQNKSLYRKVQSFSTNVPSSDIHSQPCIASPRFYSLVDASSTQYPLDLPTSRTILVGSRLKMEPLSKELKQTENPAADEDQLERPKGFEHLPIHNNVLPLCFLQPLIPVSSEEETRGSSIDLFGNVKDEDSPPDPVRALVLLFYKPPADPESEHEINVLMLPKNIVLNNVLRFRKLLDQDEIFLERPPDSKLQANQVYCLSVSPGGKSVLVQPEEAEFDAESSDNYLSKFCVSFEKMMKHISLSLMDSSSNIVWERRVCLPAAGVRGSWGPTGQNLSPQETLKETGGAYGNVWQIHQKKPIKAESESEKAEKKKRHDKVLLQPLTTDSSEETSSCSMDLNVSPSSDPTLSDSVPNRSASTDLLQTSGSSLRRRCRSNSSPSLLCSPIHQDPPLDVSILPRAASLPTMKLHSSFEEFSPGFCGDPDDETFWFRCSSPGRYQCRVSGLVFDMTGGGDVFYRVVPWNRTLLRPHGKKPAGPLFDISCQQPTVARLHLPHCEVGSTGPGHFLSVAHLHDGGVEFIRPETITETHIVISITGFSAYGNVKDEDSPPDPVRALVLLFYRPPADPESEHDIYVLMLPKNVVLNNVLRFRKKLDDSEIFLKTPPDCKLQPNQVYCLSVSPGGDSFLVQPKEAEFDAESYDNYFTKFQVVYEEMMRHISLSLRDSSSSIVWERRVCLFAAGVRRSCGPTRQNLSPQDQLMEIRIDFKDGVSGPVLQSLMDNLLREKVINDSEREAMEAERSRGDKGRVLIDTVRKKGDDASSEMIRFLCDLDPFLCKHLGLI